MLEAVFISDLHLHPDEERINQRFKGFIKWAATHTQSVYILGDFFHAWAGDDTMDSWGFTVAKQLKSLADQGIKIYFMHGNRDFLIGKEFANTAGLVLLKEPYVIELTDKPVLLVHGDRYCVHDKAHQRFRKLTRNRWFTFFFLRLPKLLRQKLVTRVRQHSQTNSSKPVQAMAIEPNVMLNHMQRSQVTTLIHGHTHQPGLLRHYVKGKLFEQYILSDWDDNPRVLCYDRSNGLFFTHIYL